MTRTLLFVTLFAASAVGAPIPKLTPATTGKLPPLDAKEWKTLPSGLKVWDVKRGGGDMEVVPGDTIVVRYTGWLSDGTVFDTNRDAKEPGTFQLASVIKGWQQGLDRMKVGGIRRLVIPAALAYGDKGVAPKIPANATLVFEIELIDTDGP